MARSGEPDKAWRGRRGAATAKNRLALRTGRPPLRVYTNQRWYPRCFGHPFAAGFGASSEETPRAQVTAKAQAPSFQLLVEVVEEVAQKRRERTALRCALIHRTYQTVLHHPSVEAQEMVIEVDQG